ncbi:TRAP transporter permease [Alloalcanivorax xenomutans]|uniref:TRAP transporter permease n=1 Tax=Alloalcanivorax xenomutans TaxID=1094342 RepID=UPI0007A733A4|nr:TRAP transporter fused permease subunit [Alloalcanivorax xenomutans]ARB48021.1 C4-dicarboxylate ABC transporter [Alloalcanivorax xenomutans]KYZ84534.1 C4-dicarboxylate ABC transporter [Alcanivorax sp. KX64203]WOA30511.1 TRAP transporter fused permease subunit [Alloalcanivorax xenomutans]WOD27389.1 TRAP transporter fused permease subunit [Alloalcanivorax xenomutans]
MSSTQATSPRDTVSQPENISGIRSLSGVWLWVPRLATLALTLITIDYLFNLQIINIITRVESQFFYTVVALMLPLVFLLWPINRHGARDRVPWYDVLLFIAAVVVCAFFVYNAEHILNRGWEYAAPGHAVTLSFLFWAIVVEAVRRAGGWPIAVIVGGASLYPIFADVMPGPIQGFPSSPDATAIYLAMSREGIMGIPLQAFANLVIGFLLFGVALQQTGGGRFFINLAFSLLGHVRGGPAKVAVFSSGLMGSMSGSVITNVMTTGVMSIPAMRRMGFGKSYAAGVEACASTGGVLMPPVMGATAFIMASFLNIPYGTIALAAVVPSVLYFLGLFIQIDAYAARYGIKGLPEDELPSLRQTLKEGWYFIFVFALLIWLLFFLRREATAPFFATALLLIINQLLPYQRWGWREVKNFFSTSGKLFAELIAILAGVGLLVGALSVTGLSGTIANDLIFLAGGNTLVLLLMGALTSFILGIGMTVTAAYIFLAVALAPALINGGGMDPLAVHLFILYWGMLSFITPPVALGAFAAATVAGARAMETGVQAMRLGSVIYFIPFLFVLNPALIFQGAWYEVVMVITQAFFGVLLIACAMQGYLLGVGDLSVNRVLEWPIRLALIGGGMLLAIPGGGPVPLTNLTLSLISAALLVPAIGAAWLSVRTMPAGQTAGT